MSIITKRMYSIVAIIALFIAIIYFALNTAIGSKWILNIAAKFIPGKLILTDIRGTLADTINIDNLTYSHNKTKITAANISFGIRLQGLLVSKLQIRHLSAENIIIALPKTTTKAEFVKPSLPIALHLRNVNLKHIVIQQNKVIDSLKLNLRTTHKYIESADIELHAPNALLQLHGKLHKNYDFNWNCNIKELNNFFPVVSGSIISQGQVIGPKNDPKINANLQLTNIETDNTKIGSLHSDIKLNLSSDQASHIDIKAARMSIYDYLIDELNIKGIITASQQATKINIKFAPTSIAKQQDHRVHKLLIKSGELNAVLNKIGLASKFHVDLPEQPPIEGNLNISKHKKLNGELKWHTKNLDFVPNTIPTVKKANGQFDADVKLFGTLVNPKFSTHIVLTNAAADIPSLNLNLKNIRMVLDGDSKQLDYTAHLVSGPGTLDINGKTDLNKANLASNVNITGENFLASNTENIKVNVSPKLKLELTTDSLKAEGSIKIPKANIQPNDLTSVATLPNDVVFVDKKHQQLLIKKKAFKVYSDVNLILGDQVAVNAFNIEGRLTGQLRVYEDPTSTTASGAINIEDGSYDIYGQQLTIRNGSISYAENAIDNPAIDVAAIRKIKVTSNTTDFDQESIIVGVRIQGPLRHPRTTFFSEPSGLSNEDMLSYLIIGQPASQLGENKIAVLLRAAQALSFGGGGNINNVRDTLRKKLGLSELDIETQTTTTTDKDKEKGVYSTTSLVAGKYLLPSLYVGYSLNLLDTLSTFRVRYKIWKGLFIQSEGNSISQGGDILYKFGME